jgi:hypothetical protein
MNWKTVQSNNLGKALREKFPGVQVLTVRAPGSGAEFRIRGFSNNASSEPL